MREHDAFGISRGATGEDDVAAHAWFLTLNSPEDSHVFDLVAKLHDLTPVVDLEILGLFVGIAHCFMEETFTIDETSNDSQFTKFVLVLAQEVILKSLVGVTDNYFGICLLNLLEADSWSICHVYVCEDAVGQNRTHDSSQMLW